MLWRKVTEDYGFEQNQDTDHQEYAKHTRLQPRCRPLEIPHKCIICHNM